jgi:hypothetical protein
MQVKKHFLTNLRQCQIVLRHPIASKYKLEEIILRNILGRKMVNLILKKENG